MALYSDTQFGSIVLGLGLCPEDHVREGLELVQRRRAAGEEARLGPVLLERGSISPYQLEVVLARRAEAILVCRPCAARFNAAGYRSACRIHCPRCRRVLVAADAAERSGPVDEVLDDPALAEDVDLLRRAVVDPGLVAPERFDAALAAQLEGRSAKRLLQILVESGDLASAGSLEVQREVQALAERRDRERPGRVLLGRLAVEAGWIEEDRVFRALRRVSELQAEGWTARIGRVLVDLEALTSRQVVELLARQGVLIGRCEPCQRQFNLVHPSQQEVFCPGCRVPLAVLEEPEDLGVIEDLVLGSAGDDRGLELELEDGSPATLGRARTVLASFRDLQGLVEDGARERPRRRLAIPHGPIGMTTFAAAGGLFLVAGALALGWVAWYSRASHEAAADLTHRREEFEDLAADHRRQAEREASLPAGAAEDGRVFELVGRALEPFQRAHRSPDLIHEVEARCAEALRIDPKTPFRPDLEMARARAAYRRVRGPDFDGADLRTRREWIEAARDRLGRARDAYAAPGATTVVFVRSAPPGGGPAVDLSLHLPAWAPERALYGAESYAWYDAGAAVIDYRRDPDVGRREMERLLADVERVLMELGE